MLGLDSGDFWVGPGVFGWFRVVLGGFGWIRMVSGGFMFYQLPKKISGLALGLYPIIKYKN